MYRFTFSAKDRELEYSDPIVIKIELQKIGLQREKAIIVLSDIFPGKKFDLELKIIEVTSE